MTTSTSTEPLVSVIIPTFNRRSLVTQAVESVLAQTYRRFDVIVMDDGSTDGTDEVIRRMSPRVRYFHRPNRGLAAARNAAIRLSSGELIALLDSDEWWEKKKLQRNVEYLQRHPQIDVTYTATRTVDAQGNPLKGHDKAGRGGYLLDDVFEDIFVHDSTAVFGRYVWENVGGFDEALPVCIGHNFFLRVAVDHLYGYIDEPLTTRIRLTDSLTRADRVRGQKAKVKMLTKFYGSHPGAKRLAPDRARHSLGRTFYSAGKICLRHGDPEAGLEYLRQAIEYCPKSPKAYSYFLWGLLRSRSARAAVL